MFTLRDISKQESITVSYTATGYHEDTACECASCNPSNPPSVERKKINENLFISKGGKGRRGGRRRKAKKEIDQGAAENNSEDIIEVDE
jgi:hypothetical protein